MNANIFTKITNYDVFLSLSSLDCNIILGLYGNHDLQDKNWSFSIENRQQKKSIENISPTKSDDDNSKRNRYDNKTIAPILYFKLDEKYFKSKKELNSIIATCFGDEFDIQTKITANGNLLLYPKSVSDKLLVLNSVTFLGITGDQVSEFKEDFVNFGIKNVVPTKNRDGRQLRICKIEVDTEEMREIFKRRKNLNWRINILELSWWLNNLLDV
ncbi:unnamed protein product [Brachionus calyciflorus]|uniref:Uncharacterized protein n=1 Tax=Brachionus calyciflorus TaxID=104777 RepID=A0A813QX19_9BILA|nr:unnamed protein product [Brachionus calyciflorus]